MAAATARARRPTARSSLAPSRPPAAIAPRTLTGRGFRRATMPRKTTKPMPYVCATCGIHGVKLWRESYIFLNNVRLLCASCIRSEENLERVSTMDDDGMIESKYGHGMRTDQLGRWIPAVPTDDGSFWGYTSVPEDGCRWWRSLRNWRYGGQARCTRTHTGAWLVRGLSGGKQLPRKQYRSRLLAATYLASLPA